MSVADQTTGRPWAVAGWATEFDRLMASGARVDRDMPGRPRVQDVNGNWFTRQGTACCGCGKHKNMGHRDIETQIPTSRPGMNQPRVK